MCIRDSANSAWFDVPLRPHVDNSAFYTQRAEGTLDSPQRNRVAPYEVGHLPSNLENLRTRYRLIPYYYSLAHLAAETGSPLIPPPGLVYPDPDLRGIAHQKLVGDAAQVRIRVDQARWRDERAACLGGEVGQ